MDVAQTKHHRITILPACIRHRVRVGAKYVVQKVNGKLRLVEEVDEDERPPKGLNRPQSK